MAKIYRTFTFALIEDIRNDILRGRYPPGHHLRLDELASNYEVSTQPVRDALRTLEGEGIVSSIPHRGTFVTSFTADELADIYEMRAELERMATRSAVPRMRAEDFAVMQSCIEQWQSAAHDIALIVRLNTRFHMTVYNASGRKHLCEEITRLRHLTHHYLHAYATGHTRFNRADNDHRAILAACVNGDVQTAADRTYDHLWRVGELLVEYFREKA